MDLTSESIKNLHMTLPHPARHPSLLAEFVPHPLLRGPHRQTVFGAFGRRAPRFIGRPERFELPDGDFVDLEHADLPTAMGPRAVVIHGLGGTAQSPYVRAMAAALLAAGWAVTLFQFRGAAGPNRTARTYHSGDTGDLEKVLAVLRAKSSHLVAIGFSLGGNVLLKHLGERGDATPLDAAVAVSVPFRLDVCARQLATGSSRMYGLYLLRALKARVRAMQPLIAPRIDFARAMRATNFYTFDDAVTAPLNGYASADDYYTRASSRGFIASIERPTLIVHALDDPFMTPAAVPTAADLAPSVTLETHAHGGHVGFFERAPNGLPRSFIEPRVVAWLDRLGRLERDR